MENHTRSFRFGLLIHGKKIWLSEFLSILFVGVVSFFLFSISLLILLNEIRIHGYDRQIAAFRVGKVIIGNELEALREENRIAVVLCSFVGNHISKSTIVKLAEIVYTNSKQFGYDPLLVLSVIKVESFFDSEAKGRFRDGMLSGALGLMQLKLETARQVAKRLNMGTISKEDLLKPEINLVIGVAYLTQLISKFHSFKLGLAAYNLGPEVVKQSLTRKTVLPLAYYRKVINTYYKLQNLSTATAAQCSPSQCD